MQEKRMRGQRLAACVLVIAGALAMAAPASGQGWSDSQGRLSFTIPDRGGWATEGDARDLRGQGGGSVGVTVTVSNASDRCHIQSQERGGAAASVADIRRAYGVVLPADFWAGIAPIAASVTGSPGQTATFQGATLDSSGFWPVNRATYTVGDLTVHVSVQGRPDKELRSFCHTWEPGDQPNTAAYDAFVASIATAQDAGWQSEAEAATAAETPMPEAQ